MTFTRITVNPNQMGSVPCIRGLRIPVATVVGMLADGMTAEEVLADLPDLEADDIAEALRFAAEAGAGARAPSHSRSVRFLIDAPLSPLLAAELPKAGHDAVHVREYGLAPAEDPVVLGTPTKRHQRLASLTAEAAERG